MRGYVSYIVRRVMLMIPTLVVASLIIFFLIRAIPGNVVDIIAGQMSAFGTPPNPAAIAKELGLNQPIYVQYGQWIGNILLHGSFGNSIWHGTPVTQDILQRLPVTAELGFMGLIIALIIALPIGVYSAVRQDTAGDYLARGAAILMMAVPSFWIAILIVVFASIWWGWSPPILYTPFFQDPLSSLQMYLVPSIVLGVGIAGVVLRMTRSMVLEVLRQDYVRTAWEKGLRERTVVIRHALKNAFIPVVVLIGLQLPVLIGGTVIIEEIFGLPGMGRLMFTAITYRDYPEVMGVMSFIAVGIVIINLIVDLTYGLLDPRIKYE